MTPEQKAAFIIAQAACATAEIAGMQAANQYRAWCNSAPEYYETDFAAVIERNVIGHNAVIAFMAD